MASVYSQFIFHIDQGVSIVTALVVASGKVDAGEWTFRTDISPGTLSETFEVLRPISPNLEGFGAGKLWVASETSLGMWDARAPRSKCGVGEHSIPWGLSTDGFPHNVAVNERD